MSDAASTTSPPPAPTAAPTAAPTVQKGRFYQTRDGRTVGPIVPGLGAMEAFGYQRNYPWIVPTQMGIPAYPVLQSGCRYWDRNDDDDLMLDTAVDAGNAVLAGMIVAIREAIAEAEAAGNSPAEIAETMAANGLIVIRSPSPDPDPHGAEVPAAAPHCTEQSPGVTPLIVREGGWYRRRDGLLVGPLTLHPGSVAHDIFGSSVQFPFIVPRMKVSQPAYSVTSAGHCYFGDDPSPFDLVATADAPATAAPVAAEGSGQVAPSSTPPTARGPASIRDDDMLAVILEEARREAEAMLGRPAPTQIAIARMVGCGYPLRDAMAAIRKANLLAFAGLRSPAVDMLSEAIVALAIASVVIREGRE